MNVNEQLVNVGATKSCAAAFAFAHGLNIRTVERRRSKFNEEKRKATNFYLQQGYTQPQKQKNSYQPQELFVVAWLTNFADVCGDKLPYGEGNEEVIQTRLPFHKKKTVYKIYKAWYKVENSTEVRKAVTYEVFTKVWKKHSELQHIKCAKFKCGFLKCSVCLAYKRKLSKQLSATARAEEDAKFLAHIEETRQERLQYYAAKVKSINNPNRCLSIIMDAMDQRKTCIPFLNNPPKEIANLFHSNNLRTT